MTAQPRECSQCGATYAPDASTTLCPSCTSAATFSDSAGSAIETTAADESLEQRQTHRIPSPPASGPSTNRRVAEGELVGAGRFVLIRRLGRGGLGEVWLAEDQQLGRSGDAAFVALKFLKEDIGTDPRRLDDFRREVLRSRGLAHPNLVRIFDWHEVPGEPVFYSMEYVEGETWQQLQSSQPERRLTWAQLRPMAVQLTDALHHAHTSHGLVHSDIKPANVLVDRVGQVKLGDFGMARRVAMVDGQWVAEVRRGGTRAYMSPQQFRGEPASPADDLYALGATLHHLLTGSLPIPDGAAFRARLESAVPPSVSECLAAAGKISDVPSTVSQAIRHCLEKQADARPRSVRDLSRRLAPVALTQLPALSEPVEDREVPPSRRRFEVRDWLILAVLMASGLAGVAFWDWRERGDQSWWGRLQPPSSVVQKPVTNAPSSEANPTEPTIATPITSREARLQLRLANGARLGPIEWRIADAQNVTHTNGIAGRDQGVDLRLPPGLWRVEAGSGPPSARSWVSQTLQLAAGADVQFEPVWIPGRHKIILNSVPDARVELWDGWTLTTIAQPGTQWAQELKDGRVESLSTRGPDLLSGLMTYRVSAPYHLTKEVTVPIEPGRTAEVRVQLEPSPYPMRGLPFTNQVLGLRFSPVGEFWAAENETTVGQFRKFIEQASPALATGPMRRTTAKGLVAGAATWRDAVADQTESHPVVGVSWRDAVAFADWLTQQERVAGRLGPQQRFGLPKVYQWARLAGTHRYPWGDAPIPSGHENLAGEEVRSGDWPRQWPVLRPADHRDAFARIAPVRQLSPNPLGLYDVGGNVSEWCADEYTASLNPPEVLAEDPDLAGPNDRSHRAVMGGNWADDDAVLLRRLAVRHWPAEERNDWTGFRLVLVEDARPGEASP